MIRVMRLEALLEEGWSMLAVLIDINEPVEIVLARPGSLVLPSPFSQLFSLGDAGFSRSFTAILAE